MDIDKSCRESTLRGRRPIALLAACVLVAGCDFTVTNPGPVQDEFLTDPIAHDALVNGAEKRLSQALGRMAHHVGALTFEITASGLVGGGAFGIPQNIRAGTLNDEETEPHWEEVQQARWIAEDALRRMEQSLGASGLSAYVPAARANLYAGFANRILGENMCQAVFDGGAAAAHTAYFTRAEQAFTTAMSIATAAGEDVTAMAAQAGRASVRVSLGDWPGAMQDAGAIPAGFVFQAQYFGTEQDQYNILAWANANQPHRSNSVIGTFYENYFTQTGDPRAEWISDPNFPFGGPAPEGQVVWFPPQKFTGIEDPMNLVSEREMRLILAEDQLIAGNWMPAVMAIDQLRQDAGAPALSPTPTTSDETWTALKRERGIELLLEARRLGDMRRWLDANRPGAIEDMTGRSLCFPIPRSEKDTNPNL